MEENTVAVRKYGEKKTETIDLDVFVKTLKEEASK
ncbi:MAG: hypothetical protein L0I88_03925 [Alkalibacterium sp.]|nr:hypothetical protein [Alkalibacterium sp.]